MVFGGLLVARLHVEQGQIGVDELFVRPEFLGLVPFGDGRGVILLAVISHADGKLSVEMGRVCGQDRPELSNGEIVIARDISNPSGGQSAHHAICIVQRVCQHWQCGHAPGPIRRITEKIDGFICSVGTGGTLAGTSAFLKSKNKDIVIGCADPCGFAMYELFKNGKAKSTPGDSITEGIGLGRVTPVIETAKVDTAFLIPDEEWVPMIYELLEHEGLCLGGSTGVNVAGAVRLAQQLGPGKTIVTILADYGNRYQSKLFNPEFMRSKNLPVPAWLEKRSKIEPPFEKV